MKILVLHSCSRAADARSLQQAIREVGHAAILPCGAGDGKSETEITERNDQLIADYAYPHHRFAALWDGWSYGVIGDLRIAQSHHGVCPPYVDAPFLREGRPPNPDNKAELLLAELPRLEALLEILGVEWEAGKP